ncbi:MAG: hypothetical protein ACKO0Z_03230, partial [Betaproteobacteria bacterium]
MVALLVACGGGGGSAGGGASGLSGQAVVGSPMSYANVVVNSLVDSSSGSYTADANGNFIISGSVTYPALVKATSLDSNYIYYGYVSDAAQTGVAVNPLSTLVLAVAQQDTPSSIQQPL